jgi:anti-anti-sigma regulatory factor
MWTEISLPAAMDNSYARELQALLLAAPEGGLRLDGSGVERLGSQCLQVLLATQARCRSQGAPFTLIASAPLSVLLKCSGAEPVLMEAG